MRYKVALFLIVFVSFLSMPTIVSLIEKKSDISVLLSVDDEEVEKEALDLYVTSEFQYFYDVQYLVCNCSIQKFSNQRTNLDSISLDKVIPPPKMV
ncbi:MAG: hypothetical protein KA481_02675 [Flavobacterium sp.]|jgi:hypothetical protein|nr:hypothetical protein [Flavobacterium sp.]